MSEIGKRAETKNIVYNDHLLILIGLPLIAGINYFITYPPIKSIPYFLLTFTLDTIEGYIAWYAGRAVIIKLDKVLPWEKSIPKRLIIQIPLIAVVVVGTIIILTEIVNAIARDKPVPLDFYTLDVIIFLIWTLVIDIYYLAYYLYLKMHTRQATKDALIISKTGKKQKVINPAEAWYFKVENDYPVMINSEGRQVLSDLTLEKLEKQLDANTFFRANRQCIISRQIISEIQKEKDGKLKVTFKSLNGIPDELIVSRLKAAAFKQWLNNTSEI